MSDTDNTPLDPQAGGVDPTNSAPSTPPPAEPLIFGPTDDEIVQLRKSYAAALHEEFAREDQLLDGPDSISHLDDPTSNVEKYTQKFFRQNLPDAAAQVVWLMANSESDSVRLRAAQMVINIAREDAKVEGDPLKDLLASLRSTPTAPASSDVDTADATQSNNEDKDTYL